MAAFALFLRTRGSLPERQDLAVAEEIGKSLESFAIRCREFVQLAPMGEKSRSAAFAKSFINRL
jgi:hypothetical protein